MASLWTMTRMTMALWMTFVGGMLACATQPAPLHAPARESRPVEAVVIAGGPHADSNQASIESNVRYVGALLPPESRRTVLFADGSLEHQTVRYLLPTDESQGVELLELLAPGHPGDELGPTAYRAPKLSGMLDGAARKRDFVRVMAEIKAQPDARPLFLYFTGHGSPDHHDGEDNVFDLWGGESLSVRELANELATLPATQPVTLVMVQCFSGSFGNIIFKGGEPDGPTVDREIAGFFATVKDRVAAGCTPEINEAEYHDFTSYFFAALSGRDRAGHTTEGTADYDGDGVVEMNEAFLFALINDPSIDVPMKTSDVFLRRFVPTSNDWDIFRPARFSDVEAWADPGQLLALQHLSKELGLNGENRLAVAYRRLNEHDGFPPVESTPQWKATQKRFELYQNLGRRWFEKNYGELNDDALKRAAQQIVHEPFAEPLLDSEDQLDALRDLQDSRDVVNAHLLRFLRLSKSIILAHRLETSAPAAVRERYARLIDLEHSVPFDTRPPGSAKANAQCKPAQPHCQ
jgi:hypothetical protein